MPVSGTYQEVVWMYVFQRRQTEEIARVRAIVQASLGEAGDAQKAFSDYVDVVLLTKKSKDEETLKEAMDKVANMRPIEITSVGGQFVAKPMEEAP
jgi:hypothetical protein